MPQKNPLMKKCKVVIVVGTRPNFIKITQFEKEFNRFGDFFDYKLVHTGQHYDQNMSQVFFGQLGLKKPDITLNVCLLYTSPSPRDRG